MDEAAIDEAALAEAALGDQEYELHNQNQIDTDTHIGLSNKV